MLELLGFNQPDSIRQLIAELGVVPLSHNVLVAGPVEHIQLRQRDRGLFDTNAVRRFPPRIRQHAVCSAAALAQELHHGPVNMVEHTTRYIQDTMGALCNIEPDDLAQMQTWAADMLTLLEPTSTEEQRVHAAHGMAAWDAWVRQWATGPAPRPGLLDDVADIADIADLINWVRSVQLAGITITRDALSGVLAATLDVPGLWWRTGQATDTAAAVVVEGMRRYTVHQSLVRTATVDAAVDNAVGDTLLRAGDRVLVHARQANLDPSVFDCPHLVAPNRRSAGRSLALGWGAHRCIGVPLAVHLLEVAVAEWCHRIPDLTDVGPRRWDTTWNFSRLTEMPVTVSTTS